MIEIRYHKESVAGTENKADFFETVKSLEEKCTGCKPLSALTCVADCKTWRMKNQLRKIHQKIDRTDFFQLLLNTLKNERRLKILDIVSKQRYSITSLQQKMKTLGYKHSRQTVLEEYIKPLVEVGLIQEGEDPYGLTVFGQKVNDLLKDFHDLEAMLPPRSECYEEKALESMLEKPATYEDVKALIPAKSVGRVLSRLQKVALVKTSKEKNYIFFFRSRRDPGIEKLTTTERRVYQKIPEEGICAGELSEKASISLRRTYKYLRKLKGKKLVFVRRKPLTYSLTDKGIKVAVTIRTLSKLFTDTRNTTGQLLMSEATNGSFALQSQAQSKMIEQDSTRRR